jgi:hypothetical protein
MQRSFKAPVLAVVLAGTCAGIAAAGASPATGTGATTDITTVSAELHGTVNPEGTATTYQFDWGLTNGYGFLSRPKSAGDGSATVAVESVAKDLIPGTVYHYRLLATSRFGTSVGADRTFKTVGHPPPGAITGPVIAVGPNTATLTGSITPNGADTSWTFQYGTTTAYGNQIFGSVVPGAAAPTPVSYTLTGLAPATLFHYRLVGTHSNSLSAGADGTFFTMPAQPERARVRAHTTPRHSRRRPYVFTTTASLSGPSNIPAQYECTGGAVIRYFYKHREVAETLAAVQPNCTFTATVELTHKFGSRRQRRHGERLRVFVRFRGNGYLAPANARNGHVRIG